MRTFDTGATRNSDIGKLDYEGFLSPRVLEAFAKYMDFNRLQEDGNVRASDNWQKGIPSDAYMKSAWRHFFDMWKMHRGIAVKEGRVFPILALLFNIQGYVDNLLKEHPQLIDEDVQLNTMERQKRWNEKKLAAHPAVRLSQEAMTVAQQRGL